MKILDRQHTPSSNNFHPEIITFGESMALLTPLNDAKDIEYSSQLDISFGGAESNVAIGLARLGHEVGWFGRLGQDPLGRSIVKQIRGEGVDVSKAVLSDDGPTGLMMRDKVRGQVSVYYYRSYSAMSKMGPTDLDEAYIAGARILHITGITPALSSSCHRTVQEAIAIAKRHGVKISFDPNLRQKLWTLDQAREVLLPLADEVDYFLPGLDELKLLYQTENFDEIVNRLSSLQAITVLKGGDNETYLVEEGQVTSVPFYKAQIVVDTVGAGDGFASGFLSGILRGWNHVDAVRLGNMIGSLVVQVPGDWQGLPTEVQVNQLLQSSEHVER